MWRHVPPNITTGIVATTVWKYPWWRTNPVSFRTAYDIFHSKGSLWLTVFSPNRLIAALRTMQAA